MSSHLGRFKSVYTAISSHLYFNAIISPLPSFFLPPRASLSLPLPRTGQARGSSPPDPTGALANPAIPGIKPSQQDLPSCCLLELLPFPPSRLLGMPAVNPLSRGAHPADRDNAAAQPPLGTSPAPGFVFHFRSLLSPPSLRGEGLAADPVTPFAFLQRVTSWGCCVSGDGGLRRSCWMSSQGRQ